MNSSTVSWQKPPDPSSTNKGQAQFAEDRDLVDTIGATPNWIQLSHAFANEVAYEQNVAKIAVSGQLAGVLGGAAIRGFLRLPTLPKYALIVIASLALTNFRQRAQVRAGVARMRAIVTSVAEAYGPATNQFMNWLQNAKDARDEHELVPLGHPTLDEQIARILASAAGPMTAPEIANMVTSEGSLADRTTAVRSVLVQHPRTFVEAVRWRYQLGSGPSTTATPLKDIEVGQYHARRRAQLGMPVRPDQRLRV